jgi:hypothetical protein
MFTYAITGDQLLLDMNSARGAEELPAEGHCITAPMDGIVLRTACGEH